MHMSQAGTPCGQGCPWWFCPSNRWLHASQVAPPTPSPMAPFSSHVASFRRRGCRALPPHGGRTLTRAFPDPCVASFNVAFAGSIWVARDRQDYYASESRAHVHIGSRPNRACTPQARLATAAAKAFDCSAAVPCSSAPWPPSLPFPKQTRPMLDLACASF